MQQSDMAGNHPKLLLLTTGVSLVCFIFSYFAMLFFNRYATVYIATDFGIQWKIVHDQVVFLTPVKSALWTRDAVISVAVAGSICCLMVGTLVLWLANVIKKPGFALNLILVWLIFHAFNLSFGWIPSVYLYAAITGNQPVIPMDQGIAFALSIIAIYFLVRIGFHSRMLIFRNAGEASCNSVKGKRTFLFFAVAVPWLMGSVFCIFFMASEIRWEIAINFLIMICIIIPVFFRSKKEQKATAQ